jgi:shikimate kinase
MTPTRPIFLLGMMGSGKSSVGRELARTHALAFVDLDRRIELIAGRSIAALFDGSGEACFRAWERAALRTLVEEPGFAHAGVVVATGGGVVTSPDNLACLTIGRSVYLEVDVATLCVRLSAAAERAARPLLREPDLERRLHELLGAREAAYRSAAIVVDGRASPAEVASAVWRQVVA